MKNLSTDHPVDSHLKPIKDSDGTATSLEISTEKVRVKDLEVTGTTTGISTGSGISDIVEDTSPQLGGDLDLNSNSIDFPTTANISDCKDQDDMSSNSATMLATQQSIKAYVDAEHYHAYNGGSYWNTSSSRYIPFGGSTAEQTSRAYNRDYITQIIMPYDGTVTKLYLYNDHSSSSDPGSTGVTVYKNGSFGDADTQALGYQTVVLFSLDQNFVAGDRIQIEVNPTGTIRYLTHNLLVKFEV